MIESCQRGELDRFGGLYDLYFDRIYRFVYRKVCHRETAEDLTAQTFFKALDKIKSFRPAKGYFSTWLYAIARNKVIDYYRTRRVHADAAGIWDLSSDEDIEADSQNRMKVAAARRYLSKLSKEQREIVVMRVWDELSYTEISVITGKSESNCRLIFSRTIAKLRKDMPLGLLIILL